MAESPQRSPPWNECQRECASHHSTRLTGAEIVWATLVGEGVDTVFGYPGGAILPVYDALRKFPIHHVLVRHEQGASHMADGYARASGKVGVAIALAVPALPTWSLALPPRCSTPSDVCITGNVSSKILGTDAFQEVDITGITLPVTKHNFLVNRTEDIAPAIRSAFQIAKSGALAPFLWTSPRTRNRPRLCSTSMEPSLALSPTSNAARGRLGPRAGRGTDSQCQAPYPPRRPWRLGSGAMEQIRTLAERAQIPVALTLLGLGAFPARIRSISA